MIDDFPEALHGPEAGTPAWHAVRGMSISASDASVLVGANPYVTREELLVRKLGGEPKVETMAMVAGLCREAGTLALLGTMTGLQIARLTRLYLRRGATRFVATPDGVVHHLSEGFEPHPACPENLLRLASRLVLEDDGLPVLVEAKNVKSKSRSLWNKSELTERIAYHWWQAQWQMFVTGLSRTVLVGSVDADELYAHVLHADAAAQAALREQGSAFLGEVDRAREDLETW